MSFYPAISSLSRYARSFIWGLLLCLPVTIFAQESYVIGIQVFMNTELSESRYRYLADYLSEQSQLTIKYKIVDTFFLDDELGGKAIDMVICNSYAYIIFAEEHQLSPLALVDMKVGGTSTSAKIVTRASSKIKSIAGLKDKRFYFVSPYSPDGFLLAYQLLLQHGINPETDLGLYSFAPLAHKHEKVAYGVWYGAYDAGGLRFDDLPRMEKELRLNKSDFRVLAESPKVPFGVFAARADFPHQAAIKKALLKIRKQRFVTFPGGGKKPAVNAEIAGFVATDDQAFDQLRQIARNCNLPPYEKFE